MIESYKKLDKTIPVLPTKSTSLLPAFHSGEAVIASGRGITEQEFK